MENQNKQVLTVIWITILCSHLILVFVGDKFLFLDRVVQFNSTLGSLIISLAIGMLIVARIAFRKATLLSSNLEQTGFNTKAFTYFVLAWAIGEGITILGLLYGVIGGSPSYKYCYYFFLVGIFLHILHRPKLS